MKKVAFIAVTLFSVSSLFASPPVIPPSQHGSGSQTSGGSASKGNTGKSNTGARPSSHPSGGRSTHPAPRPSCPDCACSAQIDELKDMVRRLGCTMRAEHHYQDCVGELRQEEASNFDLCVSHYRETMELCRGERTGGTRGSDEGDPERLFPPQDIPLPRR